MKKSYSDFVQHCMRFYVRYRTISGISSEIEKGNWVACHAALKAYDDSEKELLMALYDAGIRSDTVHSIALERHLNVHDVWNLIRGFEKEVARIRGLI